MFETRVRDAMGRVGSFNVKGHLLETPLVLPVINPNIEVLPARDIKKMGFQGVITNSYIIYRNENLRDKALSKGVKRLIGFDGVVMTDSGSYQLYQYGEVEIAPDEIVLFQEEIGSDVGVILDIPTPPDASHTKARADLEETIKRAKQAVKLKRDMLLAGTVQGSTHMDLREESAKAMAQLGFDLYPIGGVVPLMESYRFSELAQTIIHSKMFIPPDKPVHLFGAGHPMMFALAVALGCDIFDSAAYFLYARDGRYITSSVTLKVDEMQRLPCVCPVCSEYSLEELKSSGDRVRLIALHNLHITKMEINTVKEALFSGSLWELVETRCRAHPKLLEALRSLKNYPLEKYEPLTKGSAFFYSGPESLHRPEVKRHHKRLTRISPAANTLVLLPSTERQRLRSKIGSSRKHHVCYVSAVFGIIPDEIQEVYPLTQHLVPENLDMDQISMVESMVKDYSKGFEKVFFHADMMSLGIEGEVFNGLESEADTSVKMVALGDYQFGVGAGEALFKGCIGKYSRTGRLRHIYDRGVLVATVRAADGIIIPSHLGAKRLLLLDPPRNRVVLEDEEVCNFIREGKSVFSKFITDCDPEIVPGSEVIIVNKKDELMGWGKSLLSARELLAFKVGVGVKTRGSVEGK